jgi:D-glycero-alpha-D-manno-heptose-7-phosphate kinase
MIITQTPLRISFVGGGTDFPAFYRTNGGGAVISTAINKYVYVVVKARFDDMIRVSYSMTEQVDHLDELKHELVREAMRKVGVKRGIEIVTLADVPSTGSGLGSSSSVTVGVLNALYAYIGESKPPEILAREACEIEIDTLGKPIGKQDQYIAAFGGFQRLDFLPDERVLVRSLNLTPAAARHLKANLLLLYTGMARQASDILSEQQRHTADNHGTLTNMMRQVDTFAGHIQNGAVEKLGSILHEGWRFKQQLATQISNDAINRMYERALAAGATGGKIVGAGGGGFLLLYCPQSQRQQVLQALSDLRELPFSFEQEGSKVIVRLANKSGT